MEKEKRAFWFTLDRREVTMKIVVPIKQVPESSNVKMDAKTGTMIREGLQTVINPLDLYAIEAALQLKKEQGAEVIALTMGPPSAKEALREAIAMGCDEAILLSDPLFAGADTWATSYTLASAIRKISSYDLILCGERATDGDTGQVGPGLASWLEIPCATYVRKIREVGLEHLVVERSIEEGYQVLKMPYPSLLTVVKELNTPRLPTLRGKKRARQMEITPLTAKELDLNPDYLGLKGSPTRVVRITSPKVTRRGRMVERVEEILDYLSEQGLLDSKEH